jgi:hypothetical protein
MYGPQRIDIGGKSRPIKFGTNQTSILCDLRKYTLKELHEVYGPNNWSTDKIAAKDIRDLLYSGLYAGSLSAKEHVDFNEFDVGDWMDEADQAEVKKAMKLYVESLIPKDLRAKIQEAREKEATETEQPTNGPTS